MTDPDTTQTWLEHFVGLAAQQGFTLIQIANGAFETDNPHLPYVTIRIDRKLWNDLQQYRKE
jgi:hypothetical protein